jgi:hypothetical protein
MTALDMPTPTAPPRPPRRRQSRQLMVGDVIKTVPEHQIVETPIEEAPRLAEQCEGQPPARSAGEPR